MSFGTLTRNRPIGPPVWASSRGASAFAYSTLDSNSACFLCCLQLRAKSLQIDRGMSILFQIAVR